MVDMLLPRLLRLHLETSPHSVKGVGRPCAKGDGRLRCCEGACGPLDTLVLRPGVQACDGVEGAQLKSTVSHDTDDRDAEARVESKEATWPSHGLRDAVEETIKGLLARAHVRSKTRPRIVKRVDNCQTTRCGHATRSEVGTEELWELSLWIILGKHLLERVLKCQIEGLCREVADAVGEITVPESAGALLLQDSHAAVHHTSISRDLSAADLRVCILRLNHQLDPFHGSCERLRHSARYTA
mmetsp:Transcript_31362/g.68678  ORF Transcript_31362/g.68678 Transcript_31362/m.68678 type:complete len:242 (-) Transcript_31362:159-884(-)